MKGQMILATGVLAVILLSGCGGGGGGSNIRGVYEGMWTGLALHQTQGASDATMRVDFAYEGEDGFGNELFTAVWYLNDNILGTGPVYGNAAGSVIIDGNEPGFMVHLIGDINGNIFVGSFQLYFQVGVDQWIWGDWDFTLHRQ